MRKDEDVDEEVSSAAAAVSPFVRMTALGDHYLMDTQTAPSCFH